MKTFDDKESFNRGFSRYSSKYQNDDNQQIKKDSEVEFIGEGEGYKKGARGRVSGIQGADVMVTLADGVNVKCSLDHVKVVG